MYLKTEVFLLDKDIEQEKEELELMLDIIINDSQRLDALMVLIYNSRREKYNAELIEFMEKEAKDILKKLDLNYYNNDDLEVQIRDDSVVGVKSIMDSKERAI